MSKAPDTLTVVMLDDSQAIAAVVHLNETHPYEFRTVQITLTDEQREKLRPRKTGYWDGTPTYETVYRCWFEPGGDDA